MRWRLETLGKLKIPPSRQDCNDARTWIIEHREGFAVLARMASIRLVLFTGGPDLRRLVAVLNAPAFHFLISEILLGQKIHIEL
jgi:hypothetical protein